jgi:hypothetical protein
MKRGCIIALAVFALASILAAGVLYGIHRRYYGNIKFNRQQWIASADRGADNPRLRMYKDLQQRYLRKGMTRQEVRHLLGKPDYDSSSKDVDSYFLGVLGLMSVDATILEVHYDKADRVVSTAVTET